MAALTCLDSVADRLVDSKDYQCMHTASLTSLAVFTAADSTTPTKLVVRASLPSAMVAAKINKQTFHSIQENLGLLLKGKSF